MAKKKPTKNGGAQMQEPRSSYWGRQIEACSASGLSQVEFCARRGLSLAALRWWKWKLKSSSPAARATGPAERAREEGARSESPRFLPVRVLPAATAAARAAELPEPRGVYELVLRGGHRLRVPADFEPAVLHRLILTVEATAC